MRCGTLALLLACSTTPEPVVKEAEVMAPVAPIPQGPSRAETVAMLAAKERASLKGFGGGWTRVGTLRGERVLKPVCGGDVPHIGLVVDGDEARLHVFDGWRMSVLDVLGLVKEEDGLVQMWLVPAGLERPVSAVRVQMLDSRTSRWRGEASGPEWADGATWVQDHLVRDLIEVEQLGCRL